MPTSLLLAWVGLGRGLPALFLSTSPGSGVCRELLLSGENSRGRRIFKKVSRANRIYEQQDCSAGPPRLTSTSGPRSTKVRGTEPPSKPFSRTRACRLILLFLEEGVKPRQVGVNDERMTIRGS